MRQISIIGPGAIGSVLAWYLENQESRITLIGRESTVDGIRNNGIHLKLPESDSPVTLRPSAKTLQEASPFHKDSLVFVTVKSPDLLPLLKTIHPGEATWVFCQNGLGIDKIVSSVWKSCTFVRCVFWMGATRIQDNHFELRARARAEVAGPASLKVAELLDSCGLQTEIRPDVRQMEWQKALLNLAINPVGALYQVPNGEILRNPELKALATELLAEALQVAQAEGVSFPPGIQDQVWAALEATAENFNSMAQDVARGRRTEIDVLNGALIQMADKHGLPVPTNRVVCSSRVWLK